MIFDVVKIVTDSFAEIRDILNLQEEETSLILDVDTDNILIGIQYDDVEITGKMRLQIVKKINSLKKYLNCNHILINSRSVIFQGTTIRSAK